MASKFNRISAGIVVAASALFGVFSLAGGAGRVSAQTVSDAHVRVIHASPDAPAVDVYVNGNKAFSDLAFKGVTDWATLPAGSYDVKVTAAGQTASVIEAKLMLEGGKYYSVVAMGKLADIAPKVIEDDMSSLAPGKARLRVVHASPDAPAVDVAAKDGPVLVSNLSFPNASDVLTVDPMTVDVEIRPAGTTTVALAVPGLTIEAGKSYTVYAVGLLNGTPALSVLPVVDTVPSVAGTNTVIAAMPATGVADDLFVAGMLGLALAAVASLGTGVALRVRNR